ncbi:hypothetical protein INR49_008999 [Caranx melampygus]|nr:hypothetical protein INR49_008999 [Caranx melampygus]
MAQQEEPLYDFPEPAQPSARKFLGHQRGRGSLRSISVLDRLLLTVPVWLQLSINPATALHILQREPPGTFLVRKSRTSQRNVLCVRLADDSVPSFVHQFGIREEHSKFWSSHLNVRGPREAPKPQNEKEKKPEAVSSAPPTAPPPPPPTSSESTLQTDSDCQLKTAPESDITAKKSALTLFHEFCPISTRSPGELDCGSGLGALCFINPLFLQSQTALSRRRMFKRSLKVRVSMETSTMLSPPLAPPPPPPLMPKTKGRCKGQKCGQGVPQPSEGLGLSQGENPSQASQSDPRAQGIHPQTQHTQAQKQLPPAAPYFQPEMQDQGQTQIEPGQTQARVQGDEATAQQPTGMETLPEDSDYMQPTPMINYSHRPSLSPYLSPAVSSMAAPLFPKISPSLSPHSSPGMSPSLSPYQSPSLSPKVPFSLSPHDSPNTSPSLSPYQSPSPSPKVPFCLSPFTSSPFSQLAEVSYHTPAPLSRPDKQRQERDAEGEGAGADELHEKEEGLFTEEPVDGVLAHSVDLATVQCDPSVRFAVLSCDFLQAHQALPGLQQNTQDHEPCLHSRGDMSKCPTEPPSLQTAPEKPGWPTPEPSACPVWTNQLSPAAVATCASCEGVCFLKILCSKTKIFADSGDVCSNTANPPYLRQPYCSHPWSPLHQSWFDAAALDEQRGASLDHPTDESSLSMHSTVCSAGASGSELSAGHDRAATDP